ncbi:TetR/AcrR family transcriptional regulator [Gordonia crocea]|uniref:TetR family transcriptional regulator n=1 Tax=Gordonia crocea TaxID=589162 RepID=A0A7I9UYY4_9ACTN|nr:TetR/AcrR family transcriptional regulator [Gordonia crocea]GED98325.1 TetR family transcriptional regulator [Gordonia crocea]
MDSGGLGGLPLVGNDLLAQRDERADAAQNRAKLLDAAARLVAEHGAAAVTMDEVARAAGVGKGTVFRRFGSRTGLMRALLDHDEHILQHGYLAGPPPLGPGAPAVERLLAYGRARLAHTLAHRDILAEAIPVEGSQRYTMPVMMAATIHVRMLLVELGVARPEVAALAIEAPLQADAVLFLTDVGELTPDEIVQQWEQLVLALTT